MPCGPVLKRGTGDGDARFLEAALLTYFALR